MIFLVKQVISQLIFSREGSRCHPKIMMVVFSGGECGWKHHASGGGRDHTVCMVVEFSPPRLSVVLGRGERSRCSTESDATTNVIVMLIVLVDNGNGVGVVAAKIHGQGVMIGKRGHGSGGWWWWVGNLWWQVGRCVQ